ncbi:MAG: RHS repeat-associated core domain-containing protein [Verrucomicrobiae bacterium]|nr:RHS repeat-associated core domain-containing protein [Verrucomicrobiae bacterium]
MALNEERFGGILAPGQPKTMQAWGTIGTYEAREEANPIPQDSSPLNGDYSVGGLLATVIHNGPDAGVYFPFYDGNGNVMGYVRGADGLLAAQCEYGPFGELLRATGLLSQTFNYLFSTKYHDWETGLLYYGHRYYNPTTGRWPNRDPIGEKGGLNLYGFVYNDPISAVDACGLQCYRVSNKNLAFSGGRSLGPVSYSYGFSAEVTYEACDKCCGNGRKVQDEKYSVKLNASGSLRGGPWQWGDAEEMGNWRVSISGWLGFQLFATGSGSASGNWYMDKCSGSDALIGAPVCLSLDITGGINVGANLSGSLQHRVFGQWTTVLSGGMGIYGTGQAQISLTRCYDPKNGWGPFKICSGYSTSLTVDALLFTFKTPGPEYRQCFDL